MIVNVMTDIDLILPILNVLTLTNALCHEMAILHVTPGPTVQILKVMVDLDSVQFLKSNLFWIVVNHAKEVFNASAK